MKLALLILGALTLAGQTQPRKAQLRAEQVRIWDGDTIPTTHVRSVNVRMPVFGRTLAQLGAYLQPYWIGAPARTLVICRFEPWRADAVLGDGRIAYSMAHRAEWSTVCNTPAGQLELSAAGALRAWYDAEVARLGAIAHYGGENPANLK